MKKFIGYLLLTLLVVSCGPDGSFFRIEGRFRNFNQGELFVYSTDGGFIGTDTIKVFDGRFSYEVQLERNATLMLVFPNYSQQPVFAEPGRTVKINADASHLKEMKITGTDENELFTDFRMEVSTMTPPEQIEASKKFINENLKSRAAFYLLDRDFVMTQSPDYITAYELVKKILEVNPENAQALRLEKMLESLKTSVVNSTLPEFDAVDINGDTITQDTLKGKANIISLWASWNYTSQNMQTGLRKLQKRYGDTIRLLSINIDGNDTDCRRHVSRDSMLWPNICDERLWRTPLISKLGLAVIPANILTDEKGKVVGRNLSMKELESKVKELVDKKQAK